jgi:aspartyl/glutamyl-tRNA(Asn/Gln) amidotransferase C subunit
MKLGNDDVRAIAAEARLSLTDTELAGAVRYINNFLDMVDRFKELDLKDVEPFCFAETNVCPLREDLPETFSRMDEILMDRADGAGAFFKVPRIMEE